MVSFRVTSSKVMSMVSNSQRSEGEEIITCLSCVPPFVCHNLCHKVGGDFLGPKMQ